MDAVLVQWAIALGGGDGATLFEEFPDWGIDPDTGAFSGSTTVPDLPVPPPEFGDPYLFVSCVGLPEEGAEPDPIILLGSVRFQITEPVVTVPETPTPEAPAAVAASPEFTG